MNIFRTRLIISIVCRASGSLILCGLIAYGHSTTSFGREVLISLVKKLSITVRPFSS